MKMAFVVTLLLLLMGGCGDGRGAASNIVVIGNSITLCGPNPSVEWTGDWGMAASGQAKDFSHLVSYGLGLPVSVANLAQMERASDVELSMISSATTSVDSHSIVVVELSDNAPADNLEIFHANYSLLLSSVWRARKLICTGPYWPDSDKESLVQTECSAHGGTFVSISDIRYDPLNPDYAAGAQTFQDVNVNSHPHDWSMAKIAQRIMDAASK